MNLMFHQGSTADRTPFFEKNVLVFLKELPQISLLLKRERIRNLWQLIPRGRFSQVNRGDETIRVGKPNSPSGNLSLGSNNVNDVPGLVKKKHTGFTSRDNHLLV